METRDLCVGEAALLWGVYSPQGKHVETGNQALESFQTPETV